MGKDWKYSSQKAGDVDEALTSMIEKVRLTCWEVVAEVSFATTYPGSLR